MRDHYDFGGRLLGEPEEEGPIMTTLYRVFRCGKCGQRWHTSLRQRGPLYEAVGGNGPQWCPDCCEVTEHVYEGIEAA